MDSAYNIEGIKLFKSLFGTVLSIIFLAVLLNYTVYKFNSMKDFNDTNLFTSHQENYFAEDAILKGGRDSFQLAFGLVAYDMSLEGDYSQYGHINARLVSWGENGTKFIPLDTHPCNSTELGLADGSESSQFYSIFPAHR